MKKSVVFNDLGIGTIFLKKRSIEKKMKLTQSKNYQPSIPPPPVPPFHHFSLPPRPHPHPIVVLRLAASLTIRHNESAVILQSTTNQPSFYTRLILTYCSPYQPHQGNTGFYVMSLLANVKLTTLHNHHHPLPIQSNPFH